MSDEGKSYSSNTAQAIDASKSIINSTNFSVFSITAVLMGVLYFGITVLREISTELTKQTVILQEMERSPCGKDVTSHQKK
jgi:hypothetical protein